MLPYFLTASILLAATNVPDATPPETTAPAIKEVAPGVLEYKGIRMDKKEGWISFPATVNQHVGLIEYLLVNEKGKTHESLFATQMAPHDIHVAMLLNGFKENPKANAKESVPPTAIDPSYLQAAPKLQGAPIRISLTWTEDGKPKTGPAENWIFNTQTNHPMTSGPWTYNGSLIEKGVFLADAELSIIAVITDPTALVNNPRKGYNDDRIWQVREDAVPPLDTPVEIRLTLIDPSGAKKP